MIPIRTEGETEWERQSVPGRPDGRALHFALTTRMLAPTGSAANAPIDEPAHSSQGESPGMPARFLGTQTAAGSAGVSPPAPSTLAWRRLGRPPAQRLWTSRPRTEWSTMRLRVILPVSGQ